MNEVKLIKKYFPVFQIDKNLSSKTCLISEGFDTVQEAWNYGVEHTSNHPDGEIVKSMGATWITTFIRRVQEQWIEKN